MNQNKHFFVIQIAAVTLFSLAFFAFAMPFYKVGIGDICISINGFQIAFNQRTNPDNNSFIFSLLHLAIVFSVMLVTWLSFLSTLAFSNRTHKSETQKKPLSKKNLFIFLIISFLLGLVPFILGTLSVHIAGYGGEPTAQLSYGGPISGIAYFAGDCLISINFVLLYRGEMSENKTNEMPINIDNDVVSNDKKASKIIVEKETEINNTDVSEEKTKSTDSNDNNPVVQKTTTDMDLVCGDVATIYKHFVGRNTDNTLVVFNEGKTVKIISKNNDSSYDVEYNNGKIVKNIDSTYFKK